MDKNNNHGEGVKDIKCPVCGGQGHLCYHYGRHRLLRWVLGIVILLLFFWLGVKVGEFKSYFYSGLGYPMLGGWGSYYSMMGPGGMMSPYYGGGGYGPGMMRYWYGQSTTTAR